MLKPGDIAMVSGARTPFGRYCGKLKDFTAQELGAIAGKCAIERAGLDPGQFDHAVFGNAQQTSGDALYGARHVALRAGLPIETPALTVNRLCGSGMQAIVNAAQMMIHSWSRYSILIAARIWRTRQNCTARNMESHARCRMNLPCARNREPMLLIKKDVCRRSLFRCS